MTPAFKSLLRLFAFVGIALQSIGAEALLRPDDVIALVGGEDMVAMSEYGYLESLLTRARPDHRLRFRSLAWEGDTVFEQRRDLNFPPLEDQLTRIGATVVIAQFGQMESFGRKGEGRKAKGESASKDEIAEFASAYENLIGRLVGGDTKKRRVLLLSPVVSERMAGRGMEATLAAYSQAVGKIARGHGFPFVDFTGIVIAGHDAQANSGLPQNAGYARLAMEISRHFAGPTDPGPGVPAPGSNDEVLRAKIIEKNRLWFHYWRPQNWAFLNGDRTVQPSSRDHLDPSKRWFPDEIEQFIPLIVAKEREIDALAAKLSKR